MTSGKFITLEGGEGVGKSTNLEFVSAYLESRGIRVVATREPGGTRCGEQIRAILLGDGAICPEAELLLLFAARAQHMQDVIQPALHSGAWVVCDRFIDASYAYQGGGRGLDTTVIAGLEQSVLKGVTPDLTLLFDAPVGVGLARAKSRGAADRFESETIAFFERVRGVYRDRADRFPERIRLIDASRALPEVQAQIAEQLNRLCNQ